MNFNNNNNSKYFSYFVVYDILFAFPVSRSRARVRQRFLRSPVCLSYFIYLIIILLKIFFK